MVGIIGIKLGMTQVYDDKGLLIPVTVIEAGPCPVLEVRTQEKDTYSALQVGFGSKRAKNVLKPVLGHLAKTNNHENPPAVIKELRLDADSDVEAGTVLTVPACVSRNSFLNASQIQPSCTSSLQATTFTPAAPPFAIFVSVLVISFTPLAACNVAASIVVNECTIPPLITPSE